MNDLGISHVIWLENNQWRHWQCVISRSFMRICSDGITNDMHVLWARSQASVAQGSWMQESKLLVKHMI